jgi:hypothetical protein
MFAMTFSGYPSVINPTSSLSLSKSLTPVALTHIGVDSRR